MRTASYLALIFLSAFASGYPLKFFNNFVRNIGNLIGPPAQIITNFIAYMPNYLIWALVLFRIVSWIKTRSLIPSQSYRGASLLVGNTILTILLMVAIIYTFFIIKGGSGVSGIPLGYALALCGMPAMFLVISCEFKEFYSCIPGKP